MVRCAPGEWSIYSLRSIFVERLWWTVKDEWVYLRPARNGIEQKRSPAGFFDLTGTICGVRIRRSGCEQQTRPISVTLRLRQQRLRDTLTRRCREFVDSRLHRFPVHKRHSTTATTGLNSITGRCSFAPRPCWLDGL